jgi:hypothetical protein
MTMEENWQVNGELLQAEAVRERASEISAERRAAGQTGLTNRNAAMSEALDLLIDRTLLIQEARRFALEPKPSEIDETLAQLAGRYDGVAGCRAGFNTPLTREDLRRRLMVDRILDRWRASVRRPRAEDVKKYYSENKAQFHTPECINAAHIVRSRERYSSHDEGAAETASLRERVQSGEPFVSIATQYSDCPENNGELGWFPRGVMVQQFDDVAFATAAGQLTPVFETSMGFHFVLVHAARPEGILPLSEVREQAYQSLWLAKQDREVGRRLAELRSKATIRRII